MSQSNSGSDMKFIGIVVVVALVVIVSLVLFSRGDSSATPTTGTDTIKIGDTAPAFKLSSTTDSKISLADYDGKAVLLYFNEGVGCQSCWQQIISLEGDSALTSLDIPMVVIAPNSISDWYSILRSSSIKSPILADEDNSVSKSYGMLSMKSSMHAGVSPGHTFVLLDNDHKVLWFGDYPGMNMTASEIIGVIKDRLGK
ncbi:MAG: redoxin domain-containing protein [Patescibacteria group bacterium]